MTAPTLTIKDQALRAAVLRALADAVKEHADTARADLTGQLSELQQLTGAASVKVTLPDGTPIATISLAASKAAPRVTDERAFTEWAQWHHPTEVEPKVRETFRKRVLDEVVRTGELPPGVELVEGTPYVSTRFATDGREAVAAAWRAGALPDGLDALPRGDA